MDGGGSVAQHSLIDSLRKLNHQVLTASFCGFESIDYPGHSTLEGYKFRNSRFARFGFSLRIYNFLRKLTNLHKPDLIIVGQTWSLLTLFLAFIRIKAPKLHVAHTAEYFCMNSMLTKMVDYSKCEGGIGSQCLRNKCETPVSYTKKMIFYKFRNYLLQKSMDGFICHSRYMNDKLTDNGFKNVFFIPIQLSNRFERREKKKKSPIVKLLFVGTLTWNKGVIELVEAYKLLLKESSSFHLTIVGKGEKRMAIEALVAKEKMEEYISLEQTVNRDEIPEYYANCDVVIFPSFFETFGLVALEAMMSGKILVISDRGALPEIVEGYQKKIVIDSISPVSVKEAIEDSLLYLHEKDANYYFSDSAKYVEKLFNRFLVR